MKTVIVGASSGLGRRIAVGLRARGHDVALLARRRDRLEEAAAAAGPGSHAVTCDATDEESCRSAIGEAAGALGGIDGLVYATGVGPLARVEDIELSTWIRAFETNCVGASLVTAAALPHLQASRGSAAYLSTVSASHTPPWPGLAAYFVTKAALDKLIEAWRTEHPTIGFTRIVVGECAPPDGFSSEFSADWDLELARQLVPTWRERGLMGSGLIDVDELVGLVEYVVRRGGSSSIPSVTITARPSDA